MANKSNKFKKPELSTSITRSVPVIPKEERPFVDISYLDGMDQDLSYLKKFTNPICNIKIFQKFCHQFSNCESINQAMESKKGKNGIYIKGSDNNTVQKILDRFKEKYVKYELMDDTLAHLHISSKFVIFGFKEDNRFVVIHFEPNHKF